LKMPPMRDRSATGGNPWAGSGGLAADLKSTYSAKVMKGRMPYLCRTTTVSRLKLVGISPEDEAELREVCRALHPGPR
jgi:hypothetical protein